jgi:hypothetical protein
MFNITTTNISVLMNYGALSLCVLCLRFFVMYLERLKKVERERL